MSKLTLLDRAIDYLSPGLSLRRSIAREALSSYRGTVPTRTSRAWEASTSQTNVRLPRRNDQIPARDRARALQRKNPIAAGALSRCAENIIGTGIQIEPQTDSPDFNEEVSAWWENWKKTSDVGGRYHFDARQYMVFESMMRDGDIGDVLVDDGFDGKLQAIEGDYLETPPGKYLGGMMVDGVEMDATGRPARFWIRSVDPKNYKPTYTAIAAQDFIFLARRHMLSDVRGMTAFITNFEMFDMILGYFEDTVTMSRLATWYTVFIQKTNPQAALAQLTTTTNSAGEAQRVLNGEPGQVMIGKPGEEPKLLNPGMPNQSFPEALAAFVRPVGLAFGLPLEQLLFDWSRANYTVSRAIKMQIQRTADVFQQDFANLYVSRIYQWALSKAVKNGRFKSRVPDRFWVHEWLPQPLAMVDPVKEIAAAAAAVELGVDARTFIARGMGMRFSKVVQQNAADRKLMEENGLPVDDAKPAAQADPNADAPSELDTINTEMNAYGVAVRAGVVTPQEEDESYFRSRLKLPAVSGSVKAAWQKDEGSRRPITITPFPGTDTAPAIGTPPTDPSQPPPENP